MASEKNGAQAADHAEGAVLDKVKELLFGNEQRDLENRIELLERQFDARHKELDVRLGQIAENLENSAKASTERDRRILADIGERLRSLGDELKALSQKV